MPFFMFEYLLVSVVVDNFQIRGPAGRPAETDSILIVYTDAVVAAPVALQRFETIPGRGPEKVEGLRGIEQCKFPGCDVGNPGKPPRSTRFEKFLSIRATKALDHATLV
jgi:hypothetical protein